MNILKRIKIKSLKAKEILDSKGNPTIEVELETNDGVFRASVPSGTSKGKYEALELRDKNGGVDRAIKNVNELIAPKLKGKNQTEQIEIDNLMIKLDGTKNKSHLGANAILAVSIAVCRAGAAAKNLPLYSYISELAEKGCLPILPTPSLLMIEGGLHAKNQLAIQEFMILSEGKSFEEKFNASKDVYNRLGGILKEKFKKDGESIGMEGGFAPSLKKTGEALNLITEAIDKSGHKNQIKIALDAAANSFYFNGSYNFEGEGKSPEELSGFYLDLLNQYPIFSIEDPFAEEALESWVNFRLKILNSKLKNLVIGDDLTTTNPERIKEVNEKRACNAVIIKPNQIGTVTETIEAAKLAKSFGWQIIVSHRSGETTDDFIADLAVGIGADFIKTGAPARSERMAKYNRLLKIEEELKNLK